MTKTTCPVTRDEFLAHAQPVSLADVAQKLAAVLPNDGCAMPKAFATGSLGWYVGGKVQLQVNGKSVTVQVGCNLTVVGSKANGDGKCVTTGREEALPTTPNPGGHHDAYPATQTAALAVRWPPDRVVRSGTGAPRHGDRRPDGRSAARAPGVSRWDDPDRATGPVDRGPARQVARLACCPLVRDARGWQAPLWATRGGGGRSICLFQFLVFQISGSQTGVPAPALSANKVDRVSISGREVSHVRYPEAPRGGGRQTPPVAPEGAGRRISSGPSAAKRRRTTLVK